MHILSAGISNDCARINSYTSSANQYFAMNMKHAGVLAVLAASLAWALEPIFAKLSYNTSDFLHTLMFRAALATLIALVYGTLTSKANFKINKLQLSALVYVALAANLFGDIMYFYALTLVPVLNAVLIGYMQPIFIVLIGFLILKEEKLTKFDYAGILIMITAGLLITTKTLENFSTLKLGTIGDLFVLAATIAWATTTIATRKYLKALNAGAICLYRFLIVSILFTTYLASISALATPNLYQILVGIVVGIGTILYIEGLRRMKAAQAAALELGAPFFAAIISFFILGETVTSLQIMGILTLFIGVYFLSKKEN